MLPFNDPPGRRIPNAYRVVGKQRAAQIRCFREAMSQDPTLDWDLIKRQADLQHWEDNK